MSVLDTVLNAKVAREMGHMPTVGHQRYVLAISTQEKKLLSLIADTEERIAVCTNQGEVRVLWEELTTLRSTLGTLQAQQ